MEDILSVTQVAAYLGVSRQTVYRLMRSGQLGYVMVGSRRRVPRQGLDALLAAGYQAILDGPREKEA